MNTETGLIEIFVVLFSLPVGFLAGYSCIYVFNKIPVIWLCDYDEEPKEEFKSQRISSYPWKPALAMLFILACIKLGMENWQMAIPTMFAIWVIVEIIICDMKYKIIPDQFVILLCITGFGFVPIIKDLSQPVLGLICGMLPILAIYIIGRIFFKKEIIGFGDVKLMGALGFLLGPKGILFTFAGGFLLSGIIFGVGIIMKKIKLKDEEALGPYLGIMAIVYLVFYKDLHLILNIV